MLISVIILSVVTTLSLLANLLFYKAGIRHLEENELLKYWITDFKKDVELTYLEIKELDDRHIFEKDDEVGVIFQELLELINKLKDRTQSED